MDSSSALISESTPTGNRGWNVADHVLTAAMISGLLAVVIAVAVNL